MYFAGPVGLTNVHLFLPFWSMPPSYPVLAHKRVGRDRGREHLRLPSSGGSRVEDLNVLFEPGYRSIRVMPGSIERPP